MPQQPKGLYRLRIAGEPSDLIRVCSGSLEFSVPQDLYIERGILPLVDELPWQQTEAEGDSD